MRQGKPTPEAEQIKVARYATIGLTVSAICLGLAFKGQNVAFMVGLAFAIAASGNFPALLMSMLWRGYTTAGAVASMLLGGLGSVILIALSPTIMVDLLGFQSALVPLKNPAIITLPLAVLGGIVVSKLWPEPAAAAGFDAVSHQIHVGHADEA